MSFSNYVSVKEAATITGVSYMALHQRIHRGTLPVTRVSDSIILIKKSDLKKISPKTVKASLPWRDDDLSRKSSHPLFKTYYNMVRRCYVKAHKGYEHYGGRGIRVCERWLNSFECFVKDMGPKPSSKHSIDRYPNNDGNYEPGNCRWATAKEQANNQRPKRGKRKC